VWTLRDDQRYCAVHDQTFGALETCSACATNPGPAPEDTSDDELSAPPKGCNSGEQHERKFTELARFAETLAKKLAKKPASVGSATKVLAEAIKARRAASVLAAEREDREFVTKLERRRRGLDREVGN